MTKPIVAVFFSLMFIACWRVDDDKRNAFPNVIQNSKLAKHRNIVGTRVFLVPPKDSRMSSKFKGIEKGNSTMIEVTEVKANFDRTAASFSKEEIERAGYTVLEFKELTVNGFRGKMALLRGRGANRSYSLAFGDSTFSTFIYAKLNGRDAAAGEEVRLALASVYYDKSKEVSLYVPAVFALNDSKSIFKYTQSAGGKNIYSLRGKVKDNYKAEPYVVAGNVPALELGLEKIADQLMLIPGNYNIGNTHENTTNGFPSLTREVFGEFEGREVFIFQHLVQIDETVVCMQGVAVADDFEKYLDEFKKLTNTVSKKQSADSPVPIRVRD